MLDIEREIVEATETPHGPDKSNDSHTQTRLAFNRQASHRGSASPITSRKSQPFDLPDHRVAGFRQLSVRNRALPAPRLQSGDESPHSKTLAFDPVDGSNPRPASGTQLPTKRRRRRRTPKTLAFDPVGELGKMGEPSDLVARSPVGSCSCVAGPSSVLSRLDGQGDVLCGHRFASEATQVRPHLVSSFRPPERARRMRTRSRQSRNWPRGRWVSPRC